MNPDGTTTIILGRGDLIFYLERVHEIALGPAGAFQPGATYYITVKAILKPLDLEDLEEIESWLSGDVTGGRGGSS